MLQLRPCALQYAISLWSDWSSSFRGRYVIPRPKFMIIFSLLFLYQVSLLYLKMFSTLACHYFIMACNFITKVSITLRFFDQFILYCIQLHSNVKQPYVPTQLCIRVLYIYYLNYYKLKCWSFFCYLRV